MGALSGCAYFILLLFHLCIRVSNTATCEDSRNFDCASLERTSQICSKFLHSQETRVFCPKYCGICSDENAELSSSKSSAFPSTATASSPSTATVWATRKQPQSAQYDGPCVDDPGIDCADLNRTAPLCTTFRHSDDTKKYCPKFCGLCGTGNPSPTSPAMSTSSLTSAMQHVTAAPYHGPCVDDPSFDCADMDRTGHICTTFRESDDTRKYCPKYCGLCGTGNPSPTLSPMSTSSLTSAMQHVTASPYHGPCVDDPSFDCADMDRTAHICTTFRESDDTRKYCPKYCGLCGTGNPSPTSSPMSTSSLTSAMQHVTAAPYHGPCVDDPSFDCADMDRTAHICTTFRESDDTRKYCPKYCGLCGTAQATPSPAPVSGLTTSSSSFTGPCVDAMGMDCADLDRTAHICTTFRDSQNTRDLCPRYCHLCTPEPVSVSTCHDADGADCADLDRTANICTTFRDSQSTRELCPKFCGLCSDGATTEKTSALPPSSSSRYQSTTRFRDTTTHQGLTAKPSETTTSRRPDSTPTKPTDTTIPRRPDSTSTKPTDTTAPMQHTDRTTSRNPGKTSTKLPETTAIPHTDTTSILHHRTSQPATTVPVSMTTPSLEQIFELSFQRSDIDHDGALSLLDFEKLWLQQDVNGDRRVTIAEYAAVSHFSKFITTELFLFIDHDHNGVISLQEVPRLFMEYDSNSDGVIEKAEFIAEFRRIYNFVKDHVK
ncbi:mucin-5AC-like isoform X2 [Haliotis rufescens]|uniref:mucin-5AC-like isoform X2 n=1 Tax=Haliotis rufescens TaxID=6454 RepID=UPI00201F4FA0|nr:mucin-5AC-like isoform X2 [Haliotis rufescens]